MQEKIFLISTPIVRIARNFSARLFQQILDMPVDNLIFVFLTLILILIQTIPRDVNLMRNVTGRCFYFERGDEIGLFATLLTRLKSD